MPIETLPGSTQREMSVGAMEARASARLSPPPIGFAALGLELSGVGIMERGAISTDPDIGKVSYEYSVPNSGVTVEVRILNGRRTFLAIGVSGGGKWFSFRDYLKHVGAADPDGLLWRPEDEPFEDHVDRMIGLATQHFGDGLRDVIQGRAWVDVPFDYRGYR